MTTEDKIKLRQDAQSKLKDLFGSECVMTDLDVIWLGADKYMIEIKVNIAGVPFECHSTKGINQAIDELLEKYRVYMQKDMEILCTRKQMPEIVLAKL